MDITFIPQLMKMTYSTLSGFAQWISTPILFDWTPLTILFGGGLAVIITLHVVHLVNPLG